MGDRGWGIVYGSSFVLQRITQLQVPRTVNDWFRSLTLPPSDYPLSPIPYPLSPIPYLLLGLVNQADRRERVGLLDAGRGAYATRRVTGCRAPAGPGRSAPGIRPRAPR